MDPITLAALFSGGSSLAGLFMNDDPTKAYNNSQGAAQRFINPKVLSKDASELFDLFRRGPAFGAARGHILSSAAQSQRRLTNSFGARGLSGTGLAALGPAGLASGGFQLADLNAAGWQDSLDKALQLMSLRQGAVGGVGQPKWGAGDKFASFNDALGRLLQALALGQKGKK